MAVAVAVNVELTLAILLAGATAPSTRCCSTCIPTGISTLGGVLCAHLGKQDPEGGGCMYANC